MVNIPSSENRPSGSDSDAKSYVTAPESIERRLQQNTIISILLFVILAWLLANRQLAFGVTLGSVLSYINYRWLHSSLKAIFVSVASGQESPPSTSQGASKFILRWLFIMAVIMISVRIGSSDLSLGILLGLFSLGSAVLMEAIAQLWWAIQEIK